MSEPLKNELARSPAPIKERFQRERLPLSELPSFLNKQFKLDVPVYTVWGACEDVSVLEKLRSSEYKIDNLHVIDESHSRLLDIGGVKLRLLGLGGAVVMHKMFDNGEGRTTIAGGQGTMWTTLLQIGELIDTASRVYDPTETRVLITHSSPAREGILNQLAVNLKVDFSISAGLHFRYGSSYNEFSVNPSLDHYRGKLAAAKAQFNDVWETVKHEVEPAVAENDAQHKLLQHALELVKKMPDTASGGNPFGGGPPNGQIDESAFKNMWNFNLADAAFGWLVLDIDQGRIGTEMRAQGFNFSHRGGKAPQQRPQAVPSAPSNQNMPAAGGNLPPPAQQQPPQAQQQAQRPPQGPAAQQAPNQPRGQQPAGQSPPQQPKPAAQQQSSSQNVPKATTPQPAAALTANGTTAPTATIPQTNGTPAADAAKPDTPKNNVQQSPGAQEQSKAIFVNNTMGITSEDELKTLFTPEDVAKITNIERRPQGPFVVHFETPEIMQEVLKRSPTKEGREKYSAVRMTVFLQRRGAFGGGWGSGRGGPARGGADASRGGYHSAGGTTGSDSETNRGGRGRGRGGRGGFEGRGGRGRGRGDRGGKTDGASNTAAAPATSGGDA